VHRGVIKGIHWEEQLGLVYLRVRANEAKPWDLRSVALTLEQFKSIYSRLTWTDKAFEHHTDEQKLNVMRGREVFWDRKKIRIE
jgi:hypothetical protein